MYAAAAEGKFVCSLDIRLFTSLGVVVLKQTHDRSIHLQRQNENGKLSKLTKEPLKLSETDKQAWL